MVLRLSKDANMGKTIHLMEVSETLEKSTEYKNKAKFDMITLHRVLKGIIEADGGPPCRKCTSPSSHRNTYRTYQSPTNWAAENRATSELIEIVGFWPVVWYSTFVKYYTRRGLPFDVKIVSFVHLDKKLQLYKSGNVFLHHTVANYLAQKLVPTVVFVGNQELTLQSAGGYAMRVDWETTARETSHNVDFDNYCGQKSLVREMYAYTYEKVTRSSILSSPSMTLPSLSTTIAKASLPPRLKTTR